MKLSGLAPATGPVTTLGQIRPESNDVISHAVSFVQATKEKERPGLWVRDDGCVAN